MTSSPTTSLQSAISTRHSAHSEICNSHSETPTHRNSHTVPPPTPKLLDQVRNAIRVRHYSIRTEHTYIQWIRDFILYQDRRHPRDMGVAEINAWLTHLAVDRNVAASTQNQALCAIIFLYRVVLDRKIGSLGEVVRAKKPERLPVVMTVEETTRFLSSMTGTKRLLAELMYGTGLRLIEALRIRVKDVDFGRRTIIVRDGKGQKDRAVMLPERLIEPLKSQMAESKKLHEQDIKDGCGTVHLPFALAKKYPYAAREWSWKYVFPAPTLSVDPRSGVRQRHHIYEKWLQTEIRNAARAAGINKPVHSHTLRHYAEFRIMPSRLPVAA